MPVITPSLMVSFGVGATTALASSQPRGVGSISMAFMEFEPMSIPTLDSLLNKELSTTCNMTSCSFATDHTRIRTVERRYGSPPIRLSSFAGLTGGASRDKQKNRKCYQPSPRLRLASQLSQGFAWQASFAKAGG